MVITNFLGLVVHVITMHELSLGVFCEYITTFVTKFLDVLHWKMNKTVLYDWDFGSDAPCRLPQRKRRVPCLEGIVYCANCIAGFPLFALSGHHKTWLL